LEEAHYWGFNRRILGPGVILALEGAPNLGKSFGLWIPWEGLLSLKWDLIRLPKAENLPTWPRL